MLAHGNIMESASHESASNMLPAPEIKNFPSEKASFLKNFSQGPQETKLHSVLIKIIGPALHYCK